MDSKLLLVCLSGLFLSCYAAPFDPVATANSWVGSLSAQHVPVTAILQSPVVKPIVVDVQQVVVATPIVKAATVAVASPVIVAQAPIITPVVKSATVAVAPSVIVAEAPEPLDAPNPPMPTADVPFVGGQFHAQDEMGQYAFGHHGGSNTRVETRDYLGRVTGSFSYVNPEGDVHVRKYAAASGMGFKVAGSDIPVDTPEVAAAKVTHAEAIATAKAASSS
ncbi:unnamed protein product [Meganyctiphanes norvegica]|uniref:Cuticle protein n=1 Tax=Meganyctiphanes norvegica TaxID=48144 RepID=A0AAV2SN65_MEGNR